MNDDLQVAIVTGAARGIGLAIAQRLTADGFRVVLTDVDGEEVAKQAEALPGAIGLQHDVRDAAAGRAVVEHVLAQFGRIDVLVNNAGTNIHAHPTVEVTEEDFNLVIDVNLKGTFLTTQAVLPTLQKGGGRIVNMSSILGLKPVANVATYCASKYAVTGLTQSWAAELAQYDITANSVHPGIVATALHDRVVEGVSALTKMSTDDAWAEFQRSIPLQRFQTVEDVAAVVAFLVSPAAKDITGSEFKIDGGMGVA
ncbi:SDR family NAD(P)-dependent oxidoreductase [Microbacterium sp. A196]|uniref:SDR family NAD(P)-dependent oxidoreductase n=1 Tax=Microbacterium sp. A196 TaxID=3457320 RepID=UPI003FCEE9AB